MENIIIFSIIHEIISFLLLLTLTRICSKIFQYKNIKEDFKKYGMGIITRVRNINKIEKTYKIQFLDDVLLSVQFIVFMLSSIVGLINKNILLFVLYMIILVLIYIYMIVKKDKYLASYMLIFAVYNLIISIIGSLIVFDKSNIFLAYIVTISLSPLSFSKNITFSFIIGLSVIMIYISKRILKKKEDVKDNY